MDESCCLTGALFYGLARIEPLLNRDRTAAQTIAMVSDPFICVVRAGYAAVELSVHQFL
jgi:hypothetical protein